MHLTQNKMINQSAGFVIITPKALLPFLTLAFMMFSYMSASAQQKLMVRIAEI
jgi:hypothetical protein